MEHPPIGSHNGGDEEVARAPPVVEEGRVVAESQPVEPVRENFQFWRTLTAEDQAAKLRARASSSRRIASPPHHVPGQPLVVDEEGVMCRDW